MAERVAHVVRFYGRDDTADGGPDNSDLWVDCEIIDKITIETGRGPAYQRSVYTFEYEDGENSSRDVVQKRIFIDGDEDSFVEVPVNARIQIETGRKNAYQKRILDIDNTEENETRVVHTKKVYHNDIGDEFLNDDDQPPSDPQEYLDAIAATNSQDTSLFIEVEVIEEFTIETGRGPAYQKTRYALFHEDDILMQEPLVPIPE